MQLSMKQEAPTSLGREYFTFNGRISKYKLS